MRDDIKIIPFDDLPLEQQLNIKNRARLHAHIKDLKNLIEKAIEKLGAFEECEGAWLQEDYDYVLNGLKGITMSEDKWETNERGTADKLARYEEALRPFAEFLDTYKEWRFGPDGYLLQKKAPDHIPVLRWYEPTPPPGVRGERSEHQRLLQLWVSDFERAREALKE